MATALIHITAAYFENYNFNEGTENPNWRPKGAQLFSVAINEDLYFHADENLVIDTIKEMLQEQCTQLAKFEYHSHTPIFAHIEQLDSKKFEDSLVSKIDKGE